MTLDCHHTRLETIPGRIQSPDYAPLEREHDPTNENTKGRSGVENRLRAKPRLEPHNTSSGDCHSWIRHAQPVSDTR
jgi:hypothetical protein